MTIEQLRTVHHANAFRPFTIHMADGRQIRVPHRDFMWQAPTGRTVVVQNEDETLSILDLLLMTELRIDNGQAAPKGKSKPSVKRR